MPENDPKPVDKTFTQEEVDRIVKDRMERFGKKFEDYDELKAKAEQSKTLEEKIAEFNTELQGAKTAALRSDVATKHGISAEDRDLFLTGTDEDTLTAQAKRLSERVRDQQQHSNVAPLQGHQPSGDGGNEELREFTRNLFNQGDD